MSLLIGVGFIYHREHYKFIDIELLERSSFIKGKREVDLDKKLPFYMTRYHSFKIFFKDGRHHTMLIVKDHHLEEFEKIVTEVSVITGIKVFKA